MKKIIISISLFCCLAAKTDQAHAQAQELEQLTLDIEKLTQLKSILSELKQGYDVLSGGYNTIKDLSQGNFDLHKTFLDGLLSVSPTVRNYKAVAVIIYNQTRLVSEYKAAWNKLNGSGRFNVNELQYIGSVYNNLLNESLRDLDDLTTILTDSKLRATDQERLREIDRVAAGMDSKLSFLRSFNDNTSLLALQRARQQTEIKTIQRYYGIQP